jgi:hypothetical protein
MPSATYEPIATFTVVNSTTRIIDFTSLSQAYTDLELRITGGYTVGDCNFYMWFNNDTDGANYGYVNLQGSGTVVGNYRGPNSHGSSGWYPYSQGNNQPHAGIAVITMPSYTNTSIYKYQNCMTGVAVGTSNAIGYLSNWWRNTSAINRLTLDVGTYQTPYFTVGTTVTVFGIKAE